MASHAAIFDETGMCVVDEAQIKRRIQAMGAEEEYVVGEASVRLVYYFVRLAHSHDMMQVGDEVVGLTKLLKDIIMDYNTTYLKTFKGDLLVRNASSSSAAQTTPNNEKTLRTLIETVASSTFDPANILAMLCQHFGVGNIDECIAKIPAAFNNFNPVYLEDAVWLQCCKDGACNCKTLPEDINVTDPRSALVAFLSCMNHKRAYNGVAGFERAHTSLAAALAESSPTVRWVRFPLRETLVACVGGGSVEAIRAMSLEDRAFVAMVYTFLFFSRYVSVSGDMLNRVLYVIAVKFILKSVEMLFYEYENATRDTDKGLFLKYIVGYLPSVIMAAPFAIEKAYAEWRNELFAGPILELVHNIWKNSYSDNDVWMASKTLVGKVNQMSQKSKFSRDQKQEYTLGSIRSVRNMENYIPFGLYRVTRAQNGVVTSIESENGSMNGLTKRHSNGMNLPCNAFSVLPELDPLVQLGPKGRGDQTRFELSIFGNKVKDTSYGRVDGFIMCMIDKLLADNFRNIFSDDETVDGQVARAISRAVSEIMFERNRVVSTDVINNIYMLPDIQNVDRLPFAGGRGGGEIPSMDLGPCTVFMSWKRPVLPSPNIDALGIAQLELTMSRDPKWAPVLTQLFFFIGRIASQIIHSTISNLYGPNPESLETDKDMITKAMTEAVKNVKSEWVREGGEDELQQQLSLKIGSKRSFNQSSMGKDQTSSSTTKFGGPKASVSLKLHNCLRDICIVHDWSPFAIISYAEFLARYCGMLDEFVMSVSTNPSSLDFVQGC